MAKKRWKRKQRAPRVMIWHTSRRTGMALIWGRDLVRLSPGDARLLAEKLEHAALEVDPDWDPDTEVTLPDSLESQLSSEVEAAMDQGPAAPPSSSVSLGGTARLAEELGSARETLAEILGQAGDCRPETVGSLKKTPQEDQPDARLTRLTPAFPGAVRADGQTQIKQASEGSPPPDAFVPRTMRLTPLERLMSGLTANPGEPGKIWINSQLVCLGDAIKYRAALGQVIDKQRDMTFGATLMASVATAEPPVDVPTLRAD